MTTRALVHSHEGYRDWDLARENLRKRAIRERFNVGDDTYFIVVEPLIKKSKDGKLLQTIRVRHSQNKSVVDLIGNPVITNKSGQVISVAGESAPKGSYRVFVPEVSAEESVVVSFEKKSDIKINLAIAPQRHWTMHLVHHTHLDRCG